MISETESFRTKEYDNYFMITDNIINENSWSFSSDSSLMLPEETDIFLLKSDVI